MFSSFVRSLVRSSGRELLLPFCIYLVRSFARAFFLYCVLHLCGFVWSSFTCVVRSFVIYSMIYLFISLVSSLCLYFLNAFIRDLDISSLRCFFISLFLYCFIVFVRYFVSSSFSMYLFISWRLALFIYVVRSFFS